MSVILLRSLVLYILVIFSVRLMGKRQLGELQPSELVITILVSDIATLPIEDVNIPLLVGITPILSLVCFEVIVSWINLKSPRFRKVISGSPKIIIRNGKIERDILRELRFSVDDLMMALRENEVFDLNDVQFAIVETSGSVSVMKKPQSDTPTRIDMNITAENIDPPQIIVSDGRIIEKAAEALGINEIHIKKVLRSKGFKLDEVFIMSADRAGKYFIADNKGSTPCVTERGEII